MTQKEARFILETIIQRETKRLMVILKPYHAELIHIRSWETPASFMTKDRQFMSYIGPTTEQLSGRPYEAPKWLEEIIEADSELQFLLKRYKDNING